MADIFISYSRADREPIQSLAEALQAAGFSVWWDRKIGGGTEFASEIEKELSAAKTIVVVWSEASIGSHWVRDEAGYARGENKLLPLSLDGVLPPLGFRQLHALEFQDWDRTANHAAFVRLLSSIGEQPSSAAADPSPKTPRWTKPSIAVLPFINLSTDKEIEFLADGITEDVIAELSTNHHISVAARSSSFAYKNQSADVREIGRASGARYVVEGSVRKMGKRARVSAQFISVESGAHIWANKFDHTLEELYDNPDELVIHISGSVFAQLISAEQERANKLPDDALGIWEQCQRATSGLLRAVVSVSAMRQGLENLESAIERAPEYHLAHAILSMGCNAALSNGAYEDHEQAALLDKAKKHLRIARAGSEGDLYCLAWIGAAEGFFGLHEGAARRLERVLQRNPANPEALFTIAQSYAFLGRHDEARDALARAIAIAPEGPLTGLHQWWFGLLAFVAGRYEEALPFIKAQTVTSPEWGFCQVLAAITTYILGDEAEARRYIAKAKGPNPHLRPEKLFGVFGTQHDREKGAREFAILQKLWAV